MKSNLLFSQFLNVLQTNSINTLRYEKTNLTKRHPLFFDVIFNRNRWLFRIFSELPIEIQIEPTNF